MFADRKVIRSQLKWAVSQVIADEVCYKAFPITTFEPLQTNIKDMLMETVVGHQCAYHHCHITSNNSLENTYIITSTCKEIT